MVVFFKEKNFVHSWFAHIGLAGGVGDVELQ
jgi:hypothetical protein